MGVIVLKYQLINTFWLSSEFLRQVATNVSRFILCCKRPSGCRCAEKKQTNYGGFQLHLSFYIKLDFSVFIKQNY